MFAPHWQVNLNLNLVTAWQLSSPDYLLSPDLHESGPGVHDSAAETQYLLIYY